MKNHTIAYTTILFAAAWFLRLPQAQAINPPPDGCYPNFTTAEGCNALKALTSGAGNTGIGAFALFQNTEAGSNTAVGAAALALNNADQKLGTVPVDANGNKMPFKPQAMIDESFKQQSGSRNWKARLRV